jgi:hypothetical protein
MSEGFSILGWTRHGVRSSRPALLRVRLGCCLGANTKKKENEDHVLVESDNGFHKKHGVL